MLLFSLSLSFSQIFPAQELEYVIPDTSASIISKHSQQEESIEPAPGVATEDAQLWTDEQWKKASEGIRYERDKEKKEPEENEEFDPITESSDFDLAEWLSNIFLSPVGKLSAIVLIIALLVMMILRLVQNRNVDSKVKLKQGSILTWEDSEDIPEESDMEKFLRESLEKGEYKMAVRILYLMVIRELISKELILWKKDKTNRDYLNEMRTQKHYPQFRELTRIFEIVWYGDFNVNQVEFEKIRSTFSDYKYILNQDAEKK